MKKTILFVVGLIVIGGGAFYGGMKYEKNSVSKMTPQQLFSMIGGSAGNGNRVVLNGQGGAGNGQFRNRDGSGGAVAGEIIAKDASSITVKGQDGGSKIVLLSSSTEISKTVSGQADDLAVGKTVNVSGSSNQDGSISAKNVQIRPAFSPVPTPSK